MWTPKSLWRYSPPTNEPRCLPHILKQYIVFLQSLCVPLHMHVIILAALQVSKLRSQKVFSGISGQVIRKMSTFFSLCDAHTAANARQQQDHLLSYDNFQNALYLLLERDLPMSAALMHLLVCLALPSACPLPHHTSLPNPPGRLQ